MTTYYVTTIPESLAALAKAKKGDIIYFDEGGNSERKKKVVKDEQTNDKKDRQ